MPNEVTAPDVPELAELQAAPDRLAREAAWDRLLERYSGLIMAVARGLGGGHDSSLDRYSYVLERLRDDDFRRLRAFQPAGPARFSTWLVVASRRLCVDHHRARFGRTNGKPDGNRGVRSLRRRLALDDGESVDVTAIPDPELVPPLELLDQRARDAALIRLLESLAPRDRLLLTLRFQDELSAREIARTLNLPTPFHVYRRIQTLLRQLRLALAGDPLFRERD